jgi:hypothetical protein
MGVDGRNFFQTGRFGLGKPRCIIIVFERRATEKIGAHRTAPVTRLGTKDQGLWQKLEFVWWCRWFSPVGEEMGALIAGHDE